MPPKKTKAKGVTISPEEAEQKNKARKAKSAEKKAAKLRAAEDRVKFLKTESLRREVERGDMNAKRLCRTWRDMVMSVKMPQIKEDLEVAWHTFDRALDIKNYSISLLLDEMDIAQEQYQMNERGHIAAIDRLMDTYKIRLANEKNKYEKELREMIVVTINETEAMIRKQTDDEVYLQAMMFGMEQRLEVLMKSVKGATLTKVGEVGDSNKSFRRVTEFTLERKFHELWEEYVANLTKYQTDTEGRRKDYSMAKEKDDRARRIISRQLTKTGNLFESIRKLKDKIVGYKLISGKEIGEILAERDFFNEAYWTVKTRFISEQNVDKDQLRIITAEFSTTTKHLMRLLTKGDNLLSLVKICRKYETLEEKVIPFKPQIELDEYHGQLGIDFGWERSRSVMDEFRNLEAFWRRVGSAQIISRQLRTERNRLRDEGVRLRKCLEHCLNERSLPPLEPTPEMEA